MSTPLKIDCMQQCTQCCIVFLNQYIPQVSKDCSHFTITSSTSVSLRDTAILPRWLNRWRPQSWRRLPPRLQPEIACLQNQTKCIKEMQEWGGNIRSKKPAGIYPANRSSCSFLGERRGRGGGVVGALGEGGGGGRVRAREVRRFVSFPTSPQFASTRRKSRESGAKQNSYQEVAGSAQRRVVRLRCLARVQRSQ